MSRKLSCHYATRAVQTHTIDTDESHMSSNKKNMLRVHRCEGHLPSTANETCSRPSRLARSMTSLPRQRASCKWSGASSTASILDFSKLSLEAILNSGH
jgi:hypothetical protein